MATSISKAPAEMQSNIGNREPEILDWEVLPPEEKRERAAIEPLFRWVAILMDGLVRVPGTKFRFGLNPLMDFIPAVGDVSAAFVSTSVLIYAMQHGLPKILLARMGFNVLINELVGIIPGVGSLFALWFRCNQRNYELLRVHAGAPRARRRSDWIFVGAVIGILLLIIFCGFLFTMFVVAWLWRVAFSR